MTLLTFDEKRLRGRLIKLDGGRQLLFGLSTASRLLPNYEAFTKIVGWGKSSLLAAALDFLWNHERTLPTDADAVRRLIADVDAVIPDTENFSEPLVSAALDAGTAVVDCLEFSIDGDIEHILSVASVARDTVDMHVQELLDLSASDPKFEDVIREHELMQAELAHQEADLVLLEKTATTTELAAALRHAQAKRGGSLRLGV